MLLFRSEESVEKWCAERSLPVNPMITLDQLWEMAQAWYSNRLTETRTAFGTELDEFDALRVKVRGWGIDAIVSNFDEAALERLRAVDGVENVQADAMPLEEIFLAIAGESAKSGERKEREGGAAA